MGTAVPGGKLVRFVGVGCWISVLVCIAREEGSSTIVYVREHLLEVVAAFFCCAVLHLADLILANIDAKT